ncbi:MAG: hypothetical protein FJ317_07095, partial [SAR202 cluster bacterium]|nr:hypothetical protein [SAR202 cluster bacterium]
MRAFLALFRKDLKSFFDQPTGYILLVIFVVSMAVVEFYSFPSVISANGILASNEASIFPMMALAPWILLFIVPVATMRLLAEELRDGTLEILLTQPLRMWTVIMSKFSAGLAFITIGLLMTVTIPIALVSAGNVDAGAVAAQYIATILLTGSFVSIGLFASSLTRSQVVPAIAALFIIAVLLIIG